LEGDPRHNPSEGSQVKFLFFINQSSLVSNSSENSAD